MSPNINYNFWLLKLVFIKSIFFTKIKEQILEYLNCTTQMNSNWNLAWNNRNLKHLILREILKYFTTLDKMVIVNAF